MDLNPTVFKDVLREIADPGMASVDTKSGTQWQGAPSAQAASIGGQDGGKLSTSNFLTGCISGTRSADTHSTSQSKQTGEHARGRVSPSAELRRQRLRAAKTGDVPIRLPVIGTYYSVSKCFHMMYSMSIG